MKNNLLLAKIVNAPVSNLKLTAIDEIYQSKTEKGRLKRLKVANKQKYDHILSPDHTLHYNIHHICL